jgi:hypothetical protein
MKDPDARQANPDIALSNRCIRRTSVHDSKKEYYCCVTVFACSSVPLHDHAIRRR